MGIGNVPECGHSYRDCPKCFGYTLIISGTGKATDFKFGTYIYRANPNKSPLKFWRKWSMGVSRSAQILGVTPIISGTGKAMDFKFGGYITGPIRIKAH